MVELLLDENNYIRDHINKKNLYYIFFLHKNIFLYPINKKKRDITKLIETIGLNDGEA